MESCVCFAIALVNEVSHCGVIFAYYIALFFLFVSSSSCYCCYWLMDWFANTYFNNHSCPKREERSNPRFFSKFQHHPPAASRILPPSTTPNKVIHLKDNYTPSEGSTASPPPTNTFSSSPLALHCAILTSSSSTEPQHTKSQPSCPSDHLHPSRCRPRQQITPPRR